MILVAQRVAARTLFAVESMISVPQPHVWPAIAAVDWSGRLRAEKERGDGLVGRAGPGEVSACEKPMLRIA